MWDNGLQWNYSPLIQSLGESKGISGEFDIVLSLVSLQDCGNSEKDLVNMVVDHCDDVVSLSYTSTSGSFASTNLWQRSSYHEMSGNL